MWNKLLEWLAKYREILSYLFWGAATTVVSWGSYALFERGAGTGIVIANILSWVCAVLFAYVTNKLWVFQSRSWKPAVVVRELGLFVSARLVTGAFEIIMVPFLVKIGMDQSLLGVKGALSKVVVSFVVVLLNYVCSKLFIFQKNPEHG